MKEKSDTNRFEFKLNNYSKVAMNGRPTFHGVLEDNFEWLREKYRWNADSTLERYSKDFNNFLLLHISQDMSFDELSPSYFTDVLIQMKEDYGHSANRTMEFFRYIRRVVQAGIEHGIISGDDYIGTAFSPSCTTSEKKSAGKQIFMIKKSLSPAEEILLFEQNVLPASMMVGQNYAVLMMLELNWRPGEVVNAKFGSIVPVEGRPGKYCIRMLESMKAGSVVEQVGGKTNNAFRSRELSDDLYSMLKQREEHIKSVVGEHMDTSTMRIVCHENNFDVPCSAEDINQFIKQQFLAIKGGATTLEELDVLLFQNRLESIGVEEKNPTSYAARRNNITHLKNWGVSTADAQYLAGQDIVENHVKRSDYTNDDLFRKLSDKLENMPLHQVLRFTRTGKKSKPHLFSVEVLPGSVPLNIEDEENCMLYIYPADYDQKVTITIKVNEPNDPTTLKIRCTGSLPLQGTISQWQSEPIYKKSINCRAQINSVYRQYMEIMSKIIEPLDKRAIK